MDLTEPCRPQLLGLGALCVQNLNCMGSACWWLSGTVLERSGSSLVLGEEGRLCSALPWWLRGDLKGLTHVVRPSCS